MNWLLVALMVAVVGVLGMGIIVMIQGKNPARSNQLMMWRVGLQGVAVALLGILFMIKH